MLTIRTTKGLFVGTLAECVAFQCDMQGSRASIDGVDVGCVDFDHDDMDATIAGICDAVLADLTDAVDAWTARDDAGSPDEARRSAECVRLAVLARECGTTNAVMRASIVAGIDSDLADVTAVVDALLAA